MVRKVNSQAISKPLTRTEAGISSNLLNTELDVIHISMLCKPWILWFVNNLSSLGAALITLFLMKMNTIQKGGKMTTGLRRYYYFSA